MANRRMFSMKIVDTDAFMDMPSSSQLLYFHLAMRADDDGFVSNPKKVIRMIGVNDDDFKVLIAKKFILPFESGVCVIKHWLIHNLIRSDRYTETQYVKEKSMLVVDTKTKKYSLNKGQDDVIPLGNQMKPQDRLELGKDRKENTYTSLFEEFWKLYPKKVGKKNTLAQWNKLKDEERKLVMEDIPKRKSDDKWLNGFVKDPERYLKHRQWEDEIIPPRGKSMAQLPSSKPGKFANIKTTKI